mgnify:CR=1 FL=1
MIISIHLLQNVMSKRHLMQKNIRNLLIRRKGKVIYTYRRAQVNTLVKQMKKAVKSVDPNVSYGISPAGNIDNLTSKYSYYVDIYKWLILQSMLIISAHRYTGDLNIQLQNLIKSQIVGSRQQRARKLKLYIGIAVYRADIMLARIVQSEKNGRVIQKS